MKSPLRLLIARIDRIGDVVLSTGIPREIKKSQLNSFVAVLVKEYTKDVYLNNPHIDQIITYDQSDEDKSFLKIINELKRYKFNTAFMLLPQARLNYILFLSGIRKRIGVGHKLYQFLAFTKYVNRKKYLERRHEADYCFDMVSKLEIKVTDISPEIHLSELEKKRGVAIKSELMGHHRKLIGVNVTSGNSAPNLRVDEYLNLIIKLRSNPFYKVCVMDKIVPAKVDNLAGVTYPNRDNSLRDSIINFSTLDLLISSSTGPMHICAALKVPTISFFCPLPACSPNLWGPLGNESEIILPTQQYCKNQCPVDPKKCDYSKEGGLNAESIFKSVEQFLTSL